MAGSRISCLAKLEQLRMRSDAVDLYDEMIDLGSADAALILLRRIRTSRASILSCATSRSIPLTSRYSTRCGRHRALDLIHENTAQLLSFPARFACPRQCGELRPPNPYASHQATFLTHLSHDEQRVNARAPRDSCLSQLSPVPTSGTR